MHAYCIQLQGTVKLQRSLACLQHSINNYGIPDIIRLIKKIISRYSYIPSPVPLYHSSLPVNIAFGLFYIILSSLTRLATFSSRRQNAVGYPV